jgi:hypothetical protein
MTTVPLPVTVPVGADRNDELLVAVHEQFESAVTSTLSVPPPLLILPLVEESLTAQPAGASTDWAAWLKLTTLPLTEMLAARAAPVLAAIE